MTAIAIPTMAPPTVHLHRLALRAAADSADAALVVLHAAESVLPRALESAAASVDEEILVLRRVDLRFTVELDGSPAPLEGAVERALTRAVRDQIERARRGEAGPVITGDIAWFPDEPAAVGEHLIAIADGRASLFPFRLFSSSWGATWPDVLRACLARGRTLTGGVLAHLARSLGAAAIAARTPADLAIAIVDAWTHGDEAASVLAVADLPADIRTSILAISAPFTQSSPAQAELVALAELFARWPPARDLPMRIGDLRRLATAGESMFPAMGREAAAKPDRRASRAGGLLFWKTLFDDTGLGDAIDAAYPEPRARRAVLWALGRSLEDPRVDGVDPLLLLWSGEDPRVRIEPSAALTSADPEPLHQLAIRAARERGWLAAPLEVAPVGDMMMVTGDRICVDALPAADVHEAVPELVVRFSRRAGGPPAGLHIEERLGAEALDTLLEIDAPALPEAWRPAVRALASAARRILAVRHPHVRMSDVRHWPAVVETGGRVLVEVSRSDTARIGGGAWLRDDMRLANVPIGVRAQ